MSKKPVIVFEGIECSGKSFHINEVSKYLKKRKIDHIKIREPGGSKNSEKIRKLILNSKITVTNSFNNAFPFKTPTHSQTTDTNSSITTHYQTKDYYELITS